jgi:hypothetical protein
VELVLVTGFIVTAIWMMWTTYMGHSFADTARGMEVHAHDSGRYGLTSSKQLRKHQFSHAHHGSNKYDE